MKKLSLILALCLVCSLASSAFAAHTLSNDTFYALEKSFRDKTFAQALQSADVSDTQTFLFVPAPVEHFLPNLTYVNTQGITIAADGLGMVDTMNQIVGTAQALQAAFGDTFVWGSELAAPYEESGLGFLVAPEDIWLWAQNGQAVMLPVMFFDVDTGERVDDVYLLVAINASDSGYYSVYNDPEIVGSYIAQVEIDSEADAFQLNMIYWYVENYEKIVGEAAANETEAVDVDASAKQYMGTVEVTASGSVNVRADSNVDAEIVEAVRSGQWFFVLSIAENGWYEIQLRDGATGFFAPGMVQYKE